MSESVIKKMQEGDLAGEVSVSPAVVLPPETAGGVAPFHGSPSQVVHQGIDSRGCRVRAEASVIGDIEERVRIAALVGPVYEKMPHWVITVGGYVLILLKVVTGVEKSGSPEESGIPEKTDPCRRVPEGRCETIPDTRKRGRETPRKDPAVKVAATLLPISASLHPFAEIADLALEIEENGPALLDFNLDLYQTPPQLVEFLAARVTAAVFRCLPRASNFFHSVLPFPPRFPAAPESSSTVPDKPCIAGSSL